MKKISKVLSLLVMAVVALATPALAKDRIVFGGGPAGGTFQTVANVFRKKPWRHSFSPTSTGSDASELTSLAFMTQVRRHMLDAQQASSVRPKISIVVPVFNEEAILKSNVGAIRQYLSEREHKYEWEILIIDDGSTDGTSVVAERLARDDEKIRNLKHPRNFGLGQAFQF